MLLSPDLHASPPSSLLGSESGGAQLKQAPARLFGQYEERLKVGEVEAAPSGARTKNLPARPSATPVKRSQVQRTRPVAATEGGRIGGSVGVGRVEKVAEVVPRGGGPERP